MRLLKLSREGRQKSAGGAGKRQSAACAQRHPALYPTGENLDDLFQVGCIGLIKSIDNFDMSQNVRFSTYAVPMIIGEIRRYLRDNNSIRISRSMRDTAYKAMQVKERLTTQNLREPTVEEIAKELDLPREDIVMALESIVEPVSLYEPVYSDGGDTIYVMDQVGDHNDDNNWLDEIALKEAIRGLNDREKEDPQPAVFQRDDPDRSIS